MAVRDPATYIPLPSAGGTWKLPFQPRRLVNSFDRGNQSVGSSDHFVVLTEGVTNSSAAHAQLRKLIL